MVHKLDVQRFKSNSNSQSPDESTIQKGGPYIYILDCVLIASIKSFYKILDSHFVYKGCM